MRTGDSGFQEFDCAPYDVFPIEILAVYRLRQMLNLETPTISHELMDTSLGKLPEPVMAESDELLKRILSVIEKEVPELWKELN